MLYPNHLNPTSFSAVLNPSCTLESPEEFYQISGPHPGLFNTEFVKVRPRHQHFLKFPADSSEQPCFGRTAVSTVNPCASSVQSAEPSPPCTWFGCWPPCPSVWWQQQSLLFLFSNHSYLCIFICNVFTLI